MIAGGEYLFDRFPLGIVQAFVSIRKRNRILNGHELGRLSLPFLDGADDLFFRLNRSGCCEVPTCRMLAAIHLAELARGDASFKIGTNFRVSHLAHTTANS